MVDIIGPIAAILLIFGVYYIAQNLDTLGSRKLLDEETRKLEAEAKLRAEEVHLFQLQLEREKLLEGRRLPGSVDADYKILEDKRDKEVS